MHHQKRTSRQRKKRSHQADATGTRNVHICKGWGGGYGFTISSQRPCILSTIIRRSPADLAGLKAGDCLQFVNGVDVAELPHDEVVRLVGQSAGKLQLQVSNKFCSDSVRHGEMGNTDSECSGQVWSYSCRRGRDSKERTVPRRLVLQSVGRARSYTCLKGTGIVHSLPWMSLAQLPEQSQNDSSWSAPSVESPHRRKVTGQEFSGYPLAEEAITGKRKWFDSSREVVGCTLAPTYRRTNSVNGSFYRGTGFRSEKLPSRLSQALQYECCGEFVDCSQSLTATDPNSQRSAVESNRHAAGSEVPWNQGHRFSQSPQAAAITASVVGYIGSIQLPDSLNSYNSHLLQVSSSVRRLRKMQKLHAVVLMEVSVMGVRVTNGAGGTVAFYPAQEVVYASVCPDHRQFFGIITVSSRHGGEAAELQDVASCCSLSTCHVFMVEAFMACHARHVHRAKAFGLHCRPHPDTQLCDQFPRLPDDLVLSVTSLYTDRPHRNPQSHDFLDLEDYPQHEDSSSSGSDSGFSVGQGDACQYGAPVPGFTNEVDHRSHTHDGESDRSRISTNKPTKECQHQTTTSPMCLSPMLDSPERFLSCTPGSPDYLSRSPFFPECPYNTPKSLSPLSSSLECLTPTTPRKHNLQASLNTAFLPDSPADSKYFSTSSTNPHILSFAGQGMQTLSSDELSQVNVLSSREHAQTEHTHAGSLQVRTGVSHRLVDSFPHMDPLCGEDHIPYVDISRDCTQQKMPVLLSGLEVQQQNTQQDWSGKQDKNSQERVKAWLQEESGSDKTEGELDGAAGAESSEDAGLLPEAVASHQPSASAPLLPDDLSCDKPSGLPESQTLQRQGEIASHGSQVQRTSARASEDGQSGRVAGWAVSFPRLLADSIGLRLFTEYLQTEHSEENIHFWNDVEMFKRLSDPETRKSKALEIYNTYLSAEASDPVNVDSDARAISLFCLDTDVSVHVFDIAQKQVYHLMRMDCYGRFLNSDLYKGHLTREKDGHKLPETRTVDLTASEGAVKSSHRERRKSFLRWKNNRKSVSEDTARKTRKEKRRKQDRNNNEEGREQQEEEEEEEECGFTAIQGTEMEGVTDCKNLFAASDEREILHMFSKRSGSTLRNLFAKLCPQQRFSEQSSPHVSFSAS